ncbi:hypothetical protein GF412_05545 [Candidatus Micrarchaeota archaeon]|nr:hypothetical protein [Candidatus Micrarchaeota archaeon]MBD3418414.1 hypothetical protein [Candidatus Micrarchaeota archaeon]
MGVTQDGPNCQLKLSLGEHKPRIKARVERKAPAQLRTRQMPPGPAHSQLSLFSRSREPYDPFKHVVWRDPEFAQKPGKLKECILMITEEMLNRLMAHTGKVEPRALGRLKEIYGRAGFRRNHNFDRTSRLTLARMPSKKEMNEAFQVINSLAAMQRSQWRPKGSFTPRTPQGIAAGYAVTYQHAVSYLRKFYMGASCSEYSHMLSELGRTGRQLRKESEENDERRRLDRPQIKSKLPRYKRIVYGAMRAEGFQAGLMASQLQAQ